MCVCVCVCVCVSECGRVSSTMSRPLPTRSCSAVKKKYCLGHPRVREVATSASPVADRLFMKLTACSFSIIGKLDLCLTVHHQCRSSNIEEPARCNNNLLIYKISSTCFGQSFAHHQERETEIFTAYAIVSCCCGRPGFGERRNPSLPQQQDTMPYAVKISVVRS